jgi:hypothetical protein
MAKDDSKPKICYCIDCAVAQVFQFGYDPIIAECSDGTRNVALYPVMCAKSKPLKKIRCIENRPKKIGI